MPDRKQAAYREDLAALTDESTPDRLAAVRRLVALADIRPELRQPVADAICEYCRDPAARADDGDDGDGDDGDGDVRRAALDLLAGHLRPGDSEPWPDIDLDLSGATLVDVDLHGCELAEGRFVDTRFVGTASFQGARFDGEALFSRTVFEGDARFDDVRFGDEASFGRARFRGAAGFAGAEFGEIAWFGRGEDEIEEDDPVWESIEDLSPQPWDEPNETDPEWPIAVLVGDYQDWEEGGDGARFGGPASFRGARFAGPAWFYKARFGGAADFTAAVFDGRVHLDQPAVDVADAHWSGNDEDGPSYWPLGWRPSSGTGRLVPDDDVQPYARQLADPDPGTRRAGLRLLAELGDTRPELRERVTDAFCAYLRRPLSFPIGGELDSAQAEELRLRREAQRVLAERLRPSADPYWPDSNLWLCGATLIDLDLRGCRAGYGEFIGAQFHGSTTFADCRFDRAAAFELGVGSGVATFHGPLDVTGARLGSRLPRGE